MHQLTNKTFLRACLGLMALSLPGLIGEVLAADKSPSLVKQADDRLIRLEATAAKIQGPNARLEGGEVKNIMWWTSMDTFLRWAAKVQKPGHYRVEITYAIIGNNNGNPLAIMVGDQVVKAIPKAGHGFDDYQTGKAGEVTISKPGDLQVVLKSLAKAREYMINIRSISLIPAETPTDAIDIGGGAIKQSADGSFKLTAGDADISGMNAALETDGEKDIGFWSDVGTSLIWSIHVEKPGKYRVELNYSLMESYDGSKVAVSVGDQTIKVKPKPTKAWTDYMTGNAGEVTISKPGDLPVVVKPISKPYEFVMNLRSVALLPVETPTDAMDISDQPIAQAPDGSLILTATNAEIDGQASRLEGGDKKCLVWWNSPERIIKWPVRLEKPGMFSIEVTYSLATSTSTDQVQIDEEGQKTTVTLPPTVKDRSRVRLTAAGRTVANTLKASNGWDDFKTEELGEITLSGEDNLEVALSSLEPLGTLVMHLRSVTFVPKASE